MTGRMYYAAAAAVGLAGLAHLYLGLTLLKAPFMQFGEFFLVVAAAQLFWTAPMAKKLGRPWLYAGICGNLALFGLWVLTRMPNPLTGMGLPVNSIGIAEEAFQLAYVGIAVSLLYALGKRAAGEKRQEAPEP